MADLTCQRLPEDGNAHGYGVGCGGLTGGLRVVGVTATAIAGNMSVSRLTSSS